MKRTNKTYVRKFGGAWYQLRSYFSDFISCDECDLVMADKCALVDGDTKCLPMDLPEDGLYLRGGMYKEIGKK